MKRGTNVFLIIALTLILEVGLIYFLARPALGGALHSWRELQQQRGVLKDLESRQDVLIKLDRQKDEVEKLHSLAQDFLPEKKNEGSFVIQLEAISDARQTPLTTLAVLTAQAKGNAKQPSSEEETGAKRPPQTNTAPNAEEKPSNTPVPVNFDVNGSFRALVDLLHDLEGASRFSTIDNVNLARLQEGAVSMKVVGSIYFKEKTTASADDPKNLIIDDKVKKALESLTVHGERINLPTESGFGREDPFTPY